MPWGSKGPADHGGDEDGGGAVGAGIIDVAAEVVGVGGRGVGGLGLVGGMGVVVAKLDEDIVGFEVEGFLPAAFGDEGFGAAAGGGEVGDGDGAGGKVFRQVLAPAAGGLIDGIVAHGGVADEDDADGGGHGVCGVGDDREEDGQEASQEDAHVDKS